MKTEIIWAFTLSSMLMACAPPTANETTEEEKLEVETDSVSLTPEQINNIGIELGKVDMRNISGSIKTTGVLDVPPQSMVSISVPMGGFLKSTTLLQGTRVEKGQVIAVIENIDFIQLEQDYLESKNQLELADSEWKRQQQLASEQVNSQKSLQQSLQQYNHWKIKTLAIAQKLKLLNISSETLQSADVSGSISLYSPISGYVSEMNANIGKYAAPGEVLFEIVDTEHLHAELMLFEKDFSRVKIGQKIRFTLANEGTERTGTIFLLGREISQDRTLRIHGHIDKQDKNFLPGMYFSAIIETGGAEVLALPDDAILNYLDKKLIFIRDDNAKNLARYLAVEIKTGNSENGYTEIIVPSQQEAKGWSVVIKGAYSLLSKMKNVGEEE